MEYFFPLFQAKFYLEQNQLSCFADKKLINYYEAELEEMVQIARLCTMDDPNHRNRMTEVVATRGLEPPPHGSTACRIT
jgi:hypothetical protein